MGAGAGKGSKKKLYEAFQENEEITEDDVEALAAEAKSFLKKKKSDPSGDKGLHHQSFLEKLGGRKKVLEMKGRSQQITMLVDEQRPNGCTDHQDLIYLGAGLEKLLQDGQAMKPKFDQLGNSIASRFGESSGLSCKYEGAPVKGVSRAEVKVRVSYNGNVTYLRDTVRGTLQITSEIEPKTLEQAYDALLDMVKEIRNLQPELQVTVIRFKDSYLKPKGGYSDWQFLLTMNGYICELQVNFAEAVKEKETGQHKEYELERMAQDNLLYSAMRGDATAVRLMLKTGTRFKGVKDMNGCTPLHYAAAYGNSQMCKDLLDAGADAVELDNTGVLPIRRALLSGHQDAAERIFEGMASVSMVDTPPALAQALVSAWNAAYSTLGEKADLTTKMHDLMDDKADLTFDDQLFYAALNGSAETCSRLFSSGKKYQNTFFFDHFHGEYAFVLDCAIAQGASEVVRELLHGEANVPYIHSEEKVQSVMEVYAKRNNASALDALYVNNFAFDDKEVMNNEAMERLLRVAADHRAFDTIQLLLRRGAKLSQSDPCLTLEMELYRSVATNNMPMIEMILDANVNVNTRVNGGKAPLNIACLCGHVEVCKLLVARGADWYLANKEAITGMSYCPPIVDAIHGNRLSVIRLMHDLGYDFSKIVYGSDDSLELAKDADRKHVVSLIESFMKESS